MAKRLNIKHIKVEGKKLTNFDKMEQNFVALTEEELMDVDGGLFR